MTTSGRLPARSLPMLLLATAAAYAAVSSSITWEDVPTPVRTRLHASGITQATFPAYVERLHQEHARRVREGDLDHLVFYLLQSTRVTSEPAIEPALSARTLVEILSPAQREAFLRDSMAPNVRVPMAVLSRIASLLRALESSDPDPRLAYFRTLVTAAFPDRTTRPRAIAREYLRAMRFIYQKEFIAQRSSAPADAVEDLYKSRGLSTDTAVEAGYLVYLGLGVARSLDPGRRVRRVLIAGPGLDLAPRTGLVEGGPPESYQPWAVIDALVSLGMASADDLQVVAADINPRVVEHLRRARSAPPSLRLVTGIAEGGAVTFSGEYRDYFSRLGRTIGEVDGSAATAPGHMGKLVTVSPTVAKTLEPASLDIVTQRLEGPPFDVVIATNILPYFDDTELALAVSNVGRMLAPGGLFLHNDMRRSTQEIAAAAGLRFVQARQAVIATVRGASAPLGDSVWLYRKGGA